ncbi:MAG: energy-coupling factor ABC transporter permease [Planctomycetota bacterium]
MHMADALISPAVGGVMWVASAGLAIYSVKKLKEEANEKKAPLMGVLGAFVFAAQMINFTIPATGSSGHLGGGMILAILLGPYAAFLTLFSVLTIQSLFFADGGLLALGCNVFNMGFWPCFLAYPLIFRGIVGNQPTQSRLAVGTTLAGIIGLQIGAFSVVLETLASGISELPFGTFVLLMQPIHLGIGIVEGLVTTALVAFVWNARPEILEMAAPTNSAQNGSLRPVLTGLVIATIITGGALSWFASSHPDGLEWSMFKTSGKEELDAPKDGVHAFCATFQEKTAFLPDYDFKNPEEPNEHAVATVKAQTAEPEETAAEQWPAVSAGTSLSGLLGGMFVLLLAGLIGLVLRKTQSSQC